ncbi:MAG: hypothetical protein JJE08_06840 [Proteiniphilum sp.]|nr:hypothetical protein [Proteiniphilum sp.]
MKHLRSVIKWLKGLFSKKAKDEEVETAVSRSIPLGEAYRLYKQQQKKRGS